MKRLLTWITGVAILLVGASLLNIPINHYKEIRWWWVIIDTIFGIYLIVRGGNLMYDSIK